MEVKPGYKQTEVGVIPEDWEVHTLRSCLSAPPNYEINAPAVPFSYALPTYIRITDITEDGRFSSKTPASIKHPDAENYYLSVGEIVFARTGASVGKSYLYKNEDGKLVFAGFLIRVRPDVNKLVPTFLAEYIKTGPYWNWVRLMSMRSGQPGINGAEYGQLPIPLPPTLAEQSAIATALSDADALIQSLERLIAKKREIKQGAMQELLTGKKRLPGFGGEWELKRLEDYGSCFRGVSYDPKADLHFYDTNETVRLLRANNIHKGSVNIRDVQYVHRRRVATEQIMQLDDILICMASGSKLLVGKAASFDVDDGHDYTFGAFMGCFRTLSPATNSIYLAQLCQTKRFRDHISMILSGSSINNLRPNDIESVEFLIPDRIEQTAIATVLSDMDAEIAALDSKLTKARQIKGGMMQELLTGRIRLT